VSYAGPVIDLDVHHEWPSQDVLVSYMSRGWQEQVTGYPPSKQYPLIPCNHLGTPPPGPTRVEAYPEDGTAPGSSYELMRDQLLDPFNIERAVLGYNSGLVIPAILNPYLASELARAANDWSIEQWLDRGDDRLWGTVIVANQLPDEAAAEVRRVGPHPRMVEVRLCSNPIGKPFGHPLYHPIYEAAEELDLAIAIHIGGEAGGGMGISPIGSGVPSLYLEHHMHFPQGIFSHLVSFIAHGVFEKFPTLRLLIVEAGVAWIPWFLWRFDGEYKAIRRETPWLKRLPSEYFRDHVRVTTQPLETSPKREHLFEMLDWVDGRELICFSSDYPHWDTDEVAHVARRLPASWHAQVFRDNALALYRWPKEAAAAA
jgi:predicted TIM-barrel fold metal-dependent hydrolase